MLFLHRNNRMELLLEELGDTLQVPRRNIFAPEIVVVQSLGMERWLAMGLARRFGVWANGRHPFPRALVEEVLDAVIGPVPTGMNWTKDVVTYHLAELFDDLPDGPGLSSLRGYLTTRSDVESRLGLAKEIADAFDQAQIYRPEWFTEWSNISFEPAERDFRPLLFQLLEKRLGRYHFPARVTEFLGKVGKFDFATQKLPARISLFAVAAMPPSFLRVFDVLSGYLPIHWFLLTASREYLGDELANREVARRKPTGELPGGAAGESQPLLASFGRMMRDIGKLLEAECQYQDDSRFEFATPAEGRVLPTLQSDLCTLSRRGEQGSLQSLPLLANDDSVQVHACHGPRREMEVVREILIDAFEQDPKLQPEDVIVLLRDVEIYAPLVQAVFWSEPGKPGHVPYNLADLSLATGNVVADALALFLECATRRLTVVDIENLLEFSPVQQRFSIAPASLEKIRAWLQALGVRWGIDANERAAEGLPAQPEHTIRFGLSRLLLGVAMDSNCESPFCGMMPFDIEGEDAITVGRLVEFAETLFAQRAVFAEPRTLVEWKSCVSELMGALFSVPQDMSWQLAEIRGAIDALASEAQIAQFNAKIPVRYIATRLRESFDTTRSARAFLSRGVTFCATLPMRGIPAKLVVMVGLDDGAFPRNARLSSFDEIAKEPRVGDRLVREEDRHLFLESLLAARERFVITYTGRSARDDSPLPPSVVVEELLSVIDESFYCPTAKDAHAQRSSGHLRPSQRLLVEHPMHAYSPRYFDRSDPRLKQSQMAAFLAAKAFNGSLRPPAPVIDVPLASPEFLDIKLSELERFWVGPGEAFWQMRLLARGQQETSAIETLDPLEVCGLDQWLLMRDQFTALTDTDRVERLRERWIASGRSPAGSLGPVAFEKNRDRVSALRRAFDSLVFGRRESIRPICLKVAGTKLLGTVDGVFGAVRIDWSVSTMSAKHRLRAWLKHLALNAAANSVRSDIIRLGPEKGKPIVLERLRSLDSKHAASVLERLLSLFLSGLSVPLPFFPDVSYDFNARIAKGESRSSALSKAIRKYGDPMQDGDDDFTQPAVSQEIARLYGTTSPICDEWPALRGMEPTTSFASLAELVWEPYRSALDPVDSEEFEHLTALNSGLSGSVGENP